MYGRDNRRGFDRGNRDRGGFGRGSGHGGFGHFSDKPKPVKVGEEYDVKITDVGAKGDGITKVENFILFVPGAKKGEECRVRIKEVANKFAIAEKIGSSTGSSEASSSEAEESVEETQEESSDFSESEDKEEEQ